MHSNLFRRERGQGLAEYGSVLLFVAIVLVLIVTLFGDQVASFYCSAIHQFAPDADLSEVCSRPIVMPRLLDKGPGYINLRAKVHDPDGDPGNPYAAITRVEFYIDSRSGSPVQSDGTDPYCLGGVPSGTSCEDFNIGSLAAGAHRVIILAYDSDGNVGSATYSFTK